MKLVHLKNAVWYWLGFRNLECVFSNRADVLAVFLTLFSLPADPANARTPPTASLGPGRHDGGDVDRV